MEHPPWPFKYTAVLVEPRQHKALSFVLRNFLDNLGPEWGFLLFHGTENKTWLLDLLTTTFSEADHARIRLKSLGVADLSFHLYNQLLLSKRFYEVIPTETFLIFQTDAMICSPGKHLLKQFLKYDYVGAPWRHGGVGNGGLSLRKKSKVLERLTVCPPKVTNHHGVDHYPIEDWYFGKTHCVDIDWEVPRDEVAREFSIEGIYSPHSFGLHKAWAYLPQFTEELEAQCPGYVKLHGLQ